MRIAIVCPIGDLNRFGYWRIAQTCLESWRMIGDLFLIQSSRAAMPFKITADTIRDNSTLMQMVDGQEYFDYQRVAANANRGMNIARLAGYDVAITICVNWYVEREAGQAILDKCHTLSLFQTGFDFLYRRIQIGAQLFETDLASVAIFDLRHIPQYIVKVLADRATANGSTATMTRGNYAALNAEAYIDCEHELTTAELQEKLADVRNYEDLLPKRHDVTWDYWQRYYRERAARMIPSSDAPGPVGQSIAAQHPADAFGDWLLDQMKVAA